MDRHSRIWTPDAPMVIEPVGKDPLFPHLLFANVRHLDPKGRVLWEALGLPNLLHDTGAQYLLSAAFVTGLAGYGAPPANVYLGLDNRSTPAQTDTLASLAGEPTLGEYGYSRQALSTAGTGAGGQDFVVTKVTYYQAASKVVTWTCATQAWSAVKNLFLCTDATAVADATGKHLVCTVALTATRTLQVGDSLQASIILTPSGA